jgi:hypothetical protein
MTFCLLDDLSLCDRLFRLTFAFDVCLFLRQLRHIPPIALLRLANPSRWLSSGTGKLRVYDPPADTFERATPVLLLPGEGLSHTW